MREEDPHVELTEFGGTNEQIAAPKLPDSLYQIDEGGDRYRTGSWRRRRGMLRSGIATFSSAVRFMIGFNLQGGGTALLIVEGANAHGEAGIAAQELEEVSGDGFGEGGFGE